MVLQALSSALGSIIRTLLTLAILPLALFYSYILGSIAVFSSEKDSKVPSIFLSISKMALGIACLLFGLGLALKVAPDQPLPFFFILSAGFALSFGLAVQLFLRPEKEVTLLTLNSSLEELRRDISKIRMALEQKGIAFKPLSKQELKERAVELLRKETGIEGKCGLIEAGEEKATATLRDQKGKEYEVVLDLAGELVSSRPLGVISKTSRFFRTITGSHRRIAGIAIFASLFLLGFSFMPSLTIDTVVSAISGSPAGGEYCPDLDPFFLAMAKPAGPNVTVPVGEGEAIGAASNSSEGIFSSATLLETGEGKVWLVAQLRPSENMTMGFCLVNADTGRLCNCNDDLELMTIITEKLPSIAQGLIPSLS